MATSHQQVFGRMVARDVNSLADQAATLTAGTDRLAAEQRVAQILNLPRAQMVPTYIRLVHFLKGSDLTINFKAWKFFNHQPKGDTYNNQFGGAAMKWGGDSYMKDRDEAEQAMFDYAGLKRGGGNIVKKGILDRLKKYGQFDTNNVDFEAITRPKYCAVNYTRDPHGAASQWGKSFLVLKEHMKHNSTFVESDSFDFALGETNVLDAAGKAMRDANGMPIKISRGLTAHDHVATYFQIDRLFLYLPSSMITRMYESMQGLPLSLNVGSTAYVETHLHGELRFNRDVERIVISLEELTNVKQNLQSVIDAAKTAGTKPNLKVVSSDTIKSNLKVFANRHKIPIVFN